MSDDRAPLVCPCPPVGLVDVVGKKWAVCVISLLGRYRVVRFRAIQRCLSGVSPATLVSTLRALEDAGLVRRVATGLTEGAPRAYALTEAGVALNGTLQPFAAWLRAHGRTRGPPAARPRFPAQGFSPTL